MTNATQDHSKEKSKHIWIWIVIIVVLVVAYIDWRERNNTEYIINHRLPAAHKLAKADPDNKFNYFSSCFD